MAPDNTSLGQFNLDGLPPAPRGVPKIEVTFDIDADGILNVTAKDMASQRSQSIRITGSTRLPEAEKQRMIDQAQQYAEQDKKRREEADKLNIADSVCYQAERTLADFGSKLSEDLRRRVETAIARDSRSTQQARPRAGVAKSGCIEGRAAGGWPGALRASAAAGTAAPPRCGRADRRGTANRLRSQRPRG